MIKFSQISWKIFKTFDVAISYFCRFQQSPRSFLVQLAHRSGSWETRRLSQVAENKFRGPAVKPACSDKTFRFYHAKEAGTLPERCWRLAAFAFAFVRNYHLLRNNDFRRSRVKAAVCTRKVKTDNGLLSNSIAKIRNSSKILGFLFINQIKSVLIFFIFN